jgi:hypothetical protein
MARSIQDYNGQVTTPDSDFPQGRIKDDSGADDGTVVDETSNGDIQQFFVKMMTEAALSYNGLPDNEYGVNQFFEALRVAARPYRSYAVNMSQSGTSDPVVAIMEDQIGIVSVTRQGVGDYLINKTSGFGVADTLVICSGSSLGTVQGKRVSPNAVNVITTDLTGTPSDDILFVTSIEVRVYY